eukprot:UN10599
MKKLNAFWDDHLKIIEFLNIGYKFEIDVETLYIVLSSIHNEFAPLLAWLNVFKVGWNHPKFGIDILLYFVGFTTRKHGYPDIRQQLILANEIRVRTDLKKSAVISGHEEIRQSVVGWWNILCRMKFSF